MRQSGSPVALASNPRSPRWNDADRTTSRTATTNLVRMIIEVPSGVAGAR